MTSLSLSHSHSLSPPICSDSGIKKKEKKAVVLWIRGAIDNDNVEKNKPGARGGVEVEGWAGLGLRYGWMAR